MPGLDRRALLAGGLAVLAGCNAPVPSSTPPPTPAASTPTPTATPTLTPTVVPPHEDVAVMTYNILSGTRTASDFNRRAPAVPVHFGNRLPVLAEWIKDADPEILAVQENEPMRRPVRLPLRALLPELPKFSAVHAESDVPILFRKGRFAVKSSGIRTISTAHLRRFCSWAVLTSSESGRDILVANTHLDPGMNLRMDVIRKASLGVITDMLTRLNPSGDLPVLLLGDFNARTHRGGADDTTSVFDPLVRMGLVNSWEIAQTDLTAVPLAATLNGLGTEVRGRWTYGAVRHDGYTIDYLWCGPGITVRDWQVITGPRTREIDGFPFFATGPVPSDHCPLLAQVGIPLG